MRTLAAALIALAHGAAIAEPAISERISYYSVYGRDVLELREDIDKHRPTDPVGVQRDALTTWSVRWRLATRRTPSGCEVASVRVNAGIVMTLPKFGQPEASGRPLSGAPQRNLPSGVLQKAYDELQGGFKTYVANLLEHEKGHAHIGVEAAHEIETALRSLPPAANCAVLHEAGDAAARALVDAASKRNEAYDLETKHGQTQGARFPP